MKYELYLDENNYINGFCHYGDERDVVDIPYEVKNSRHLNCWKYEDGVFTFDSEKAEAIETAERERGQRSINIDIQTKKLAEMFVDLGINSNDFMERIDAQTLYTALMTDTLIEEEI